ncbi:metal ABC transporter substrate-binding protein [Arcanobacterium pinnipediorum]|uniref:Metal ABC transporter substrate-binding protein n=1 Tax=Arcanobacterium pinnipediorum TaxID=1503041 RepID=A0ABY5AGA2_9ACTO|nr:metal ABC transporter substrate-binding protein [Arcanobacterium pinnipediorum]USR78900.1 metal ABC transporter substrate-binding protein [Arcanobacterium pinnipediorum]
MNIKKLSRVIPALVASCALALTGCSSSDSAAEKMDSGAQMDQHSDKPVVLTTFTVIADMASQVTGDKMTVLSITEPDAEIHDYQPTPNDIKKAEKADLILNNGLGLERWFERFVADVDAPHYDLSEGVEPIAIAEGEYEGKPNPHAWMSPDSALIYVDNIVRAVSSIDKDNADYYKDNGEKYKKELASVKENMEKELASIPTDQRALVTCEGAFSYLARDMKLTEKYLWGVNAEGALTPQRMADVENFVKSSKVPAVFCESTVDNKMQPVVEATGTPFGGVLYVDSLTDADGDVPTYLDLLRYDAETITKGLTGKAK